MRVSAYSKTIGDWLAGISYQNFSAFMAIVTRFVTASLLLFHLLTLATMPARASQFTLAASGTISINNSGDPTIPIDTPWTFELRYDTAAPDLDFELTGSPDPTFGRFTNAGSPPALTFFHYRAGDYEVTLDEPADFGPFSDLVVTFTSVNALDINIQAPALFPPLAGGPVSFHADFNRFSSPPIFSSDALPTNTALGPESFEQSTVTLIPANGVVTSGSVTSLTLTRAAVSGDYNDNGQVEQADLDLVLLNWGQAFNGLPNEWVNERPTMGIVDQAELDRVLLNWGIPAGTAAVPEPATWLIATLAFLTVVAVRTLHLCA